MTLTGTLKSDGGRVTLKMSDGKEYELKNADVKPRMDGKTVRVVGVEEDSFGGDLFGDAPAILVQKLTVM